MKGCFGLFLKGIIVVLVFFGLMYLGVIDWVKEKIDNNNSPEAMIEKTKDVVDFSNIDEEYTIKKNVNLIKKRFILAEHGATGQKFIMIQSKDNNILSKEDISSDNLQDKITQSLPEKILKIEDITITKRGEMQGMNQTIPYAKAELNISGLPLKDQEGIIGVAETKSGENLLIIAVNNKGKYSQIITDSFFSKVD
ncbi:hypothetical protein II906_07270 [bacterium]|nr:hypothetical protein [bacterium]